MAVKKSIAKNKEEKFEESLAKLEEIVERLENDDVDLDEAFKLFEKGTSLVKVCASKLEKYERKIYIAKAGGNAEDGEVAMELFSEE